MSWQPQRRTAERHEQLILAAAERLLRTRGLAGAEIREVAAAAGVGVGTVYRRFGDKAGLIAAVVGEQERALQDDLLRGAPPLGPGAPPEDRLAAFLQALCRHTEANADALAAGQLTVTGGRYAFGAHGVWRLHIVLLLREINPAVDAEWTADLLLAALDPQLYLRQRRTFEIEATAIEENLLRAAHQLCASD